MTAKKLALVVACLFSVSATAQTQRQLDAHSHGEADLQIVVEGNQIAVQLIFLL